ncbi:hypothetical protein ACIRO3_07970 [Streptomyces sp. NPDC102278]|uniref:hypothetical protein n=1 Tax=Streptomyces sp. NPDC102278 TaxID=3366152 RepID=UPI0038276246
MDVPSRGAWSRAGISRDGGPLRETDTVVWLQSGRFYADSRGFAGTTSYDGGQVTFHHEVGVPGHDVGTLRREGAGLVETGTNLDGSTFLEVWIPLGGGSGEGAGEASEARVDGSWCAGGTRTVRVGPHVAHVDGAGVGAYFLLPRA